MSHEYKKSQTNGMTRRKFIEKLMIFSAGMVASKLTTFLSFYPDKENQTKKENLKRIELKERARLKKKPKFLKAEELTPLKIENLHLSGKIYKYGVTSDNKLESYYGRFERALRFKPLTDAIETKYNLPEGIIFSMMIQESNGRDVLPNALEDGGAGLCHMQAIVAQEYGLKTLETNGKLVDKELGKKLTEKIKTYKENPIKMSYEDDRFNPLINLDAVARMLVTHIQGKKIEGLGPLRTAIRRYAGKANYEDYWKNLGVYMTLMRNEKFLGGLEKNFNKNNKDLIINGEKPENPFLTYMEAFYKANAENYKVEYYNRENPNYNSERLRDVQNTYKKYLVVKTTN
jgi:hypothetical protein